MNDQEKYEDQRAKELDDERVILENQYQFLKREETRLEKAYDELKTSRLAKLLDTSIKRIWGILWTCF